MSDGPQLPMDPEPPLAGTTEEPPREPADGRYPFWSYVDVAVFAGSALPCLLLGLGIVKAVLWIFHWKPKLDAAVALPAQAVGYLLLFGVLYLMIRMYGRPFWRSLGWVIPPWSPGLVAGAGFVTAIAVVFLGSALHTPNTENEITRLMKDPVSLAMTAVFGILIAPLCEELAFRGLLQPLLVRSFGVWPGILIATVPFGMLHFWEYGNSWRHALLISLAGAAFGWMRHASRSTMASAIMHASYNALFFVAYLAARSAGKA